MAKLSSNVTTSTTTSPWPINIITALVDPCRVATLAHVFLVRPGVPKRIYGKNPVHELDLVPYDEYDKVRSKMLYMPTTSASSSLWKMPLLHLTGLQSSLSMRRVRMTAVHFASFCSNGRVLTLIWWKFDDIYEMSTRNWVNGDRLNQEKEMERFGSNWYSQYRQTVGRQICG